MASRACFSSLPVELQTEIVQLAGAEIRDPYRNRYELEVASLCAVNKTLNYIATPLLYRHILLSSISAVVSCASTLETSSVAYNAVKRLHIIYYPDPSQDGAQLLSDNAGLLSRSFPRLSNLRFLAVNVPAAERQTYEDIICRITFPCLDILAWSSTISLHLLEFLSRHPKIISIAFNLEPLKRLLVLGHTVPGADPIVMPALIRYYGELSHIGLLSCWDTLLSATVQWSGHTDLSAFEESVVALSQAKNLVEFELLWPVLSIHYLEVISEHLTNVRSLAISLMTVYASEGEDIDGDIQAALSRFPVLVKLTINSLHRKYSRKGKRNLDDDYENVRAWGQLCPSLMECTTPRNIIWLRCPLEVPVRNRKKPLFTTELVEWAPKPVEGEAQVWVRNILSKAIYGPDRKAQLRAQNTECESGSGLTRETHMELRERLQKDNDPEIVDILVFSDEEGDDEEEEQMQDEGLLHLVQRV